MDRSRKVRAVIFDIDNTLYDFDSCHKAGMQALTALVSERLSVKPEEFIVLYRRANALVTERIGDECAAIHNRLLRMQCVLENLGYSGSSLALEMYHAYWDTLIQEAVPEEGAPELIKKLKEKGIRLGIGTDMTAYIQYKKLEKLGILDDFDFILTSEEAGKEKPSSRFFGLCVEKAGCLARECVFIGDNLKKDVEGARQNGLYGIWYHPKSEVIQGSVIRSFRDCIDGAEVKLGDLVIM